MDSDGQCFDSEGHLVEFQYPDEDDEENMDHDHNDDDDDESLTQAQREEWHRIHHEYHNPPDFAHMDSDGQCFDNEGHLVEFEYPDEEDEEDMDYEEDDNNE